MDLRAVRYEPCAEFEDDAVEPGVCVACGWTNEDHEHGSLPAAA
jgi:hypothetical protein